MWIYFNVKEAREFLKEHGFVYTICSRSRRTGQALVKHGNRVIGRATIRRMGSVGECVGRFWPESGFLSKRDWLEAVKNFGKDPLGMDVFLVFMDL